MSFRELFTAVSVGTTFHYAFHLLVRFLSFWIVRFECSLSTIKGTLIFLAALQAFLLSLILFAFPISEIFAFLVAVIISLSTPLKEHLKKRTTAAYSTSDSQAQRFFNTTVFAILGSVFFSALVSPLLKFRVIESLAGQLFKTAITSPVNISLSLAFLLFINDLIIVFRYRRTLQYVVFSHGRSLLAGKLKRRW